MGRRPFCYRQLIIVGFYGLRGILASRDEHELHDEVLNENVCQQQVYNFAKRWKALLYFLLLVNGPYRCCRCC